MTEFQEKLLQTFKEFSKFCKENNLTYYAAYGTCLGAVRHHGFIPWDDDIDVFMKRDDYERMLQLRDSLAGTIYRISDIRDGEHPYTFGKFYSTDCSVWEMRQFQFIIGPWIDIFPLDEWNDSEECSKIYNDCHYAIWNYRKALSVQTWGEIWHDIIHLNGMNGFIKLVKKCFYSPFKRRFFKKAMSMIDLSQTVQGPYLKDWNEPIKRICEKQWFAEAVPVQFEDTTILCPACYDEYLTYEFGDYMTPPPPAKRKEGHHYFYKNLNKKLTSKEILAEMKQKGDLSDSEASPLSIKILIDELLHRKGF